MTTCSGKEKKTDADTSMLVEVSEVNLSSGTNLQNAHNQHADNKNLTVDEPDPISSFSPIKKNPGHEEHTVDGGIPQHEQTHVATSEVRQLASPQHTGKRTYAPEQGSQRKLEDLFAQNATFAPAQRVDIHSDSDNDNDVSIVGIKQGDNSKKKGVNFNTIKCENVLVQFKHAKEKTDECLKVVQAWPSLFD